MNPMGLILVGAGLFSVFGAALNLDWFMRNRKARLIVSMLGRGGARIFYVMLGTFLAVLGTLVTLGVIANKA